MNKNDLIAFELYGGGHIYLPLGNIRSVTPGAHGREETHTVTFGKPGHWQSHSVIVGNVRSHIADVLQLMSERERAEFDAERDNDALNVS